MNAIAYYNEIDPFAAQWLRELIKKGLIAPGFVDERSIEDVRPDELMGYTQCHFFAGIGAWSYALRQAGWPDSKPIWTGSCPCQPFSAAGKGAGFDDERHLWPSFQWLIQQRRPSIVVGEQVASKATDQWIDLVHADLEAMGYTFGCVAFPSAGVGAPHIRDRAYWVGNSIGARLERLSGDDSATGWQGQKRPIAEASVSGGMADSDSNGCKAWSQTASPLGLRNTINTNGELSESTGAVNGFWRDADWVFCRDNKWRPVEPGVSPLVDGAANTVGRLRGYGNAINAEAAKAFIECLI